MTSLREAAQAVLDRWDSPAWEWHKQGPTADLMANLRRALVLAQSEVGFSGGLGPALPDAVMAYLHAYGNSRADDDGLGGLRIAEAILALRRWAAELQAAERERCAKLLTQSASLAWSEGVAAERERLGASLERLADALEARLGTNAAEWAEVQQARVLLGRA